MSPATAEPLSPQVLIPDLLRANPAARTVLDRHGLRGCGGPFGSARVARDVARAHDVPLDRLLLELADDDAGAGTPTRPRRGGRPTASTARSSWPASPSS